MKLIVYKGFDISFLEQLDGTPLVDGDITAKINVLSFQKKTRKNLERELLDLEDSDVVWITYQEYSLIKARVDEAVAEDGLEVVIYKNNLFPDYYPIEFTLTEDLAAEIERGLDGQELGTLSDDCTKFLAVYNALAHIDGQYYGSFFNYEYEKTERITVSDFYPAGRLHSEKGDTEFQIYNNFWFTNDELELAIRRVAGILKVAKDTLDSGAYSECFKFVIEQCCPHLSDFYQNVNVTAEDPERVIGWESCSSKVPLESITLDNLQQYYGCEIEGLNYSSLSAWKDLIHVELNENDELTLLYDMLEKNYFPSSNWTKMNRCFHIIIAVLISDPKTKPKAIDYLMNRAGRMGLVILIQAYALLGDDQSGRESIEQLLRLCEALVYPSSEYNGTVVFSGNRDLEIVGEVCNSTISDWKYDGGDYVMHYLPDQKITIRWDRQEDQEPFSEEWAVKHPDKKAYSTSYYICYEQRIIKTFGMVHVDGGRALIPMPNYVTNHIDRASYKLACLVNSDIENLKRYIVSSGLIVD